MPRMRRKSADDPIRALLDWYRARGRDLPWRRNPDPWRVWVSEVMLQQTRVETVLRYYDHFLEAFPSPMALAAADPDRVLKAWEGLGYYRRATQLQQSARIVCERYGGELPGDPVLLGDLPGFGTYLTGAVCCIGFQKPVPAVDGNIERVLARLYRLESRIATASGRREYYRRMLEILPPDRPGDVLQALMDLGSMICRPRPECLQCPLSCHCLANKTGAMEEYPIPVERKRPPVVGRIVLTAVNGDGVLISRRPEKGLLAGMFEFPGVDACDPSAAAALFAEHYGLEVNFQRRRLRYRHVFTHVVWDVQVWSSDTIGGGGLVHRAPLDRLDEYPMPAAFRPIRLLLGSNPSKGDAS
jgi:A/G-specific adenine glycosylase